MAGVTADGRKPRNIKAHNLRYVLSLLREHGNYTVSEISRESNLSVTTVIKIIDKLKQSGIVVSLGKGISTREGGKKPEVFAFNKQYKYAITIYMGQQAAKYILTDLSGYAVRVESIPYTNTESFESCVQETELAVRAMVKAYGIAMEDLCGMCIGLDGIIDSENYSVIYPIHNKTWPTGDAIWRTFTKCFPDVADICIENSGRLVGQYIFLEYPDLKDKSVAVFTIAGSGAGVAGVLFNRGKAIRGAHGLVGEIGHITIPDIRHSIPCECGKTNCFEKLVNIHMLVEYAKESLYAKEESELYDKIQKNELKPMDIIHMADDGSYLCQKVLDIIIDYCFVVIENIMLTCDPQYYVVGGVYAENSQYFREQLNSRLKNSRFFNIETKINLRYIDFQNYNYSGSTLQMIDDYLGRMEFD